MPDQITSVQELAKKEQLRRYQATPHKYYVPTGIGEMFVNAVFGGDYFISLYSAANGVGKTCLGANMLANLIWPEGNGFFQQELMRNWTFPKKIRIVTEPTTVTSTIIPELYNWFPAGRFKAEKHGKNYECHWETDTGWTIDIMTYDQAVKEFESATLGLIWLDEPPPESIYKACVSRLRRGGMLFITATPLTGSAWMYDQIIGNPDHDVGRRFYIEADVESACCEHGDRGFLKHEHIENMVSQYSEEEKQARIYGKFQHLVGLVYKQWEHKVHVIRPFDINLRDYTVYHALDPHPRTKDAGLWLAVDKWGQKFVIDEFWKSCQGGSKELAANLWKIDQQYRTVRRMADPSAFIEDQHTQKSLISKIESYRPFNYLEASKARTASNRRIADALDFQKVGDEFIVTPELYVFETCKRTIYEIEHWMWQEWTGKARDTHDQKQSPVDKDDHMIENLGRILIQEPIWEPWVPNDRVSERDSDDAWGDDDPFDR